MAKQNGVALSRDHQPLVSVVLLSYDRHAYLEESLVSLVNQSYENLQITVVDNPSVSSAEVASIVKRYPNIKLIQNDFNMGYAGGMNRGIEQVAGYYVFLTEDDLVLERDCVQHLVEYLDEHHSADLIAPMIYNKTERTIRCAGGHFTLDAVYRMKIYGAGEYDTGQFPRPFDVGYIDGATMFARAEFWKQLKGFREEYFMYWEAVELCARVIKSGKKMTVVPQAKVYHFEPPDQRALPEVKFHQIKNFFALYLLHAQVRHLPQFIFRYAVLNTVRTLFGRTEDSARTVLQALRWVARETPSLLKERYKQRNDSNSTADSLPDSQVPQRKNLSLPPEPGG